MKKNILIKHQQNNKIVSLKKINKKINKNKNKKITSNKNKKNLKLIYLVYLLIIKFINIQG